MENRGAFWSGFAAGALLGAGSAAAAYMVVNATRDVDSRVLRLEHSIQIGRPVEDVFRAWTSLDRLATYIDLLKSVRVDGSRSYWRANIDGHDFDWDAETTQLIPNEAIGWKSITGPKHTGRITLSPLGDQTVLHVTMNYHPPLGRFGRLLSPVSDHLEGYIGEALRQFKNSLEHRSGIKRGPESAGWDRNMGTDRGTGTFGGSIGKGTSSVGPAGDAEDTTEKRPGEVRYTRPPEAKYP
jgi:uncharacterized membrane protein